MFVYIRKLSSKFFMRPDYPSKIFYDKRSHYVLLMQMLAEDSIMVPQT